MGSVPSAGEPLDLIDLKLLPAWVKEDWSPPRPAEWDEDEERWPGASERRRDRYDDPQRRLGGPTVLGLGWVDAIVLVLVALAIVWLLRRAVAALRRPPRRSRSQDADDDSWAATVLDRNKRPGQRD